MLHLNALWFYTYVSIPFCWSPLYPRVARVCARVCVCACACTGVKSALEMLDIYLDPSTLPTDRESELPPSGPEPETVRAARKVREELEEAKHLKPAQVYIAHTHTHTPRSHTSCQICSAIS